MFNQEYYFSLILQKIPQQKIELRQLIRALHPTIYPNLDENPRCSISLYEFNEFIDPETDQLIVYPTIVNSEINQQNPGSYSFFFDLESFIDYSKYMTYLPENRQKIDPRSINISKLLNVIRQIPNKLTVRYRFYHPMKNSKLKEIVNPIIKKSPKITASELQAQTINKLEFQSLVKDDFEAYKMEIDQIISQNFKNSLDEKQKPNHFDFIPINIEYDTEIQTAIFYIIDLLKEMKDGLKGFTDEFMAGFIHSTKIYFEDFVLFKQDQYKAKQQRKKSNQKARKQKQREYDDLLEADIWDDKDQETQQETEDLNFGLYGKIQQNFDVEDYMYDDDIESY